jgi:uncharacterized membrane protein (UPF0127 family)
LDTLRFVFDAFLRFCHRFERRVSAPVLAAAAGLLFLSGVVGYAAASDGGSSKPVAQSTTTSSTSTSAAPGESTTTTASVRTPIPGFRTANFTITPAGGAPEGHCGMLADTDDQRAKGFMGEEGLRGYDGMLFVFPQDVTASFYMANVKFPLSVAWFDGNGNYVSQADMDVCPVAADACPRYGATGPYRFALETQKGGLDGLNVGPGSALAIGPGGSCA